MSYAILSLGYFSDAENVCYYWLSDAMISYRSAINSLRWVFQLCIPSWIATALFLNIFHNPRYYVVIAAQLLLHTVFAFLSVGVMMFLTFIYQLIVRPEKRKLYIKRAFASPPNLLVLLGGVVIPFIYLSANVFSAEKPEFVRFSLIRYTNVTEITYFAFVSVFLCYSLLIWRKYEKSFLFYLVNGILLIAPFLRLGQNNDLGMNTTIPVLYILMIFVIWALFVDLSKATQNVRSAVGLICLFALRGF